MEDSWPADAMDIGGALRNAREERGLSLDQLAHATKIRVTTLQAVETNTWEKRPERIYLRGFIRAYAREVGLDPDDIARCYLEQFEPVANDIVPAASEAAHPPAPRPLEPRTDRREARFVRAQWLGIAALTLVVAVWLTGIRWPTRAEPTRRAALTGSIGATDSSPAAPARALATVRAEAATAGSAFSRPAAATDADVLQLELRASGPCWLTATVDGKRVTYRLLAAGEQQAVEMRDDAVLRIGDPASLAFSINGVTGRPLGHPNKAVTVHITRQNYRDFLDK